MCQQATKCIAVLFWVALIFRSNHSPIGCFAQRHGRLEQAARSLDETAAFPTFPFISFRSGRLIFYLLSNGARVHVDFHSDGDFDDPRGSPGHLTFSSWLRTMSSRLHMQRKKMRGQTGPRSQGRTHRDCAATAVGEVHADVSHPAAVTAR